MASDSKLATVVRFSETCCKLPHRSPPVILLEVDAMVRQIDAPRRGWVDATVRQTDAPGR